MTNFLTQLAPHVTTSAMQAVQNSSQINAQISNLGANAPQLTISGSAPPGAVFYNADLNQIQFSSDALRFGSSPDAVARLVGTISEELQHAADRSRILNAQSLLGSLNTAEQFMRERMAVEGRGEIANRMAINEYAQQIGENPDTLAANTRPTPTVNVSQLPPPGSSLPSYLATAEQGALQAGNALSRIMGSDGVPYHERWASAIIDSLPPGPLTEYFSTQVTLPSGQTVILEGSVGLTRRAVQR